MVAGAGRSASSVPGRAAAGKPGQWRGTLTLTCKMRKRDSGRPGYVVSAVLHGAMFVPGQPAQRNVYQLTRRGACPGRPVWTGISAVVAANCPATRS
jgi:hypothetical protein